MTTSQAPNMNANDDLARWRRRLGRLRLGVEPLEDQAARLRRVTWGLTFVPLVFAAILFSIVTAFGAPLLGLLVASILFGPVILFAWLDDWRRTTTMRAFLQAHPEHQTRERG